jgi:hypothetical protein
MKAVVQLLVILLLLGWPSLEGLAANDVHLFHAEQQAHQYCPADVVVWVNLASGIYHFHRQRWYGSTKNGAVGCKKEADQYGYRPTRNGQ